MTRRAAVVALLALALGLAGSGGGEPVRAERTRGSLTLTQVEPPQCAANRPASLRVRGTDFLTYCIAGLRLVDTDDVTRTVETFDVDVISQTELVARFPSMPAAGSFQIQTVNAAGRSRSRSAQNLYVSTFAAPPDVVSISPGSMSAGIGGELTITGSRLGKATQVVLVEGQRLVPLEVAAASAWSVTTSVPRGLVPGRYRVRVVTEGGLNLRGPRLTVVDENEGLPRASALMPDTLATGAGGPITITGSGLSSVDSIVLVGTGGGRTTLAATGDGGSRTAVVPASLVEGLYDVRLSSGAVERAAPRLQLAVADPASPPGCPEMRRIGSVAVQVEAAGLVTRFRRGALVYARDLRKPAASVVKSPATPTTSVGLTFDRKSLADAIAGGSAPFEGVDFVPGDDGCVASHRFAHAASGAAFRIDVMARASGVEIALRFDSPAENVFASSYEIDGFDPDLLVTLPAFGGSRFDRTAILGNGQSAPPVHTHHGLLLFEGAAGDVVVDAERTIENSETFVNSAYRPDSHAMRVHWTARQRKDALRAGEAFHVRLAAAEGGFDAVYAAARAGLVNPAPEGAKRPFAMIFELANQYAASPDAMLAVAAEVKRFERDRGTRFPRDRSLAFHLGWTENETNTGLPDYDLPFDLDFFEPALGATQMPYLNVVGAHEGTPHVEKIRNALLTTWDRDLGAERPTIWDEDQNGLFDDVHDHWYVNGAAPVFRDLILAQVGDLQRMLEERHDRTLSAFYLDLASAVVRDDRNAATGDHVDGLASLAASLRAMAEDPSIAPIAGEGLTAHTIRAGISLSMLGLLFDNAEGFRERPARTPGAFPHPAVALLGGADTRGFAHIASGTTADDPLVAYGARWLAYLQGLVPTLQLGLDNESRSAWQSDTGRRATEVELEAGAYAAAHDVTPWFEPHPAWSAPGTAMLLSVDGAPTPVSREWFRDKILLDAYWHFGGTTPSAAVFAQARALTAPNLVDVMAAVSQIRFAYAKSPTPAASVLTRAEALRRIREELGFAYP